MNDYGEKEAQNPVQMHLGIPSFGKLDLHPVAGTATVRSNMTRSLRGRRRTLTAMILMAGYGSPVFSQSAPPVYKTNTPAGLMVERWRHESDPDKFFDRHEGDLRHELWRASREQKNGLLVFFQSRENAYADLMRDSVLRNDEVHSYFKARLRTIALDKSSDRTVLNLDGKAVSEAAFATQCGVSRSPAFVFFDLHGEARYVHQRPIFNAASMIGFARCMADGIYARLDVERSLRRGG